MYVTNHITIVQLNKKWIPITAFKLFDVQLHLCKLFFQHVLQPRQRSEQGTFVETRLQGCGKSKGFVNDVIPIINNQC